MKSYVRNRTQNATTLSVIFRNFLCFMNLRVVWNWYVPRSGSENVYNARFVYSIMLKSYLFYCHSENHIPLGVPMNISISRCLRKIARVKLGVAIAMYRAYQIKSMENGRTFDYFMFVNSRNSLAQSKIHNYEISELSRILKAEKGWKVETFKWFGY